MIALMVEYSRSLFAKQNFPCPSAVSFILMFNREVKLKVLSSGVLPAF